MRIGAKVHCYSNVPTVAGPAAEGNLHKRIVVNARKGPGTKSGA